MNKPEPTILLIEDDPNDEELTRMALEENRIRNELIVVHDGEEALDYLFARGSYAGRDPSHPPQVVLLDINLPKVSGIDVLRQMRSDERTKYVPVVMFTSSKEEQDLITAYKLGANAFVRKPIEFSDFSKAICQLGMFWMLWNQAPPSCCGGSGQREAG